MTDVTCPYCGFEQEINHDDGYGYDESEDYEQECGDCEKTFNYTTGIIFSYQVTCQDKDHDMVPSGDKWPGMYECKKCDFCERRD
ncbi:MAG: hypothetical protein GY750_11285 [Lentisphaerae bacterium]|nr:hypothetical protein [Lentisphaerota bacterium]